MRELPRKLFHLSGLLFHPLALILGDYRRLFFLSLLLAITLFETLRLTGCLRLPGRLSSLLRESEFRRPTGTFYYLWGVGLSFLLFPLKAALCGLWVLALGDGISGLFGRGPLHHLVFFALSLCVFLFFGLPFGGKILLLSGILTLIEALPFPDDNLTLPLATALGVRILSSLPG